MEHITVFNVLGQAVYQNTPQIAQKHQSNVAHFASGFYTIRIKTNEGLMTRKFDTLKLILELQKERPRYSSGSLLYWISSTI